jgi:hypothetical protein
MLICVAFRILPQEELEQWLPPGSPLIRFRTVHLNVLSPLRQTSYIDDSVRQDTRSVLLHSIDPEIRQRPEIWRRQVSRREAKLPYIIPPRLKDYANILNITIKQNAHLLGVLEPFNKELHIPPDWDPLWHCCNNEKRILAKLEGEE